MTDVSKIASLILGKKMKEGIFAQHRQFFFRFLFFSLLEPRNTK